MKHNKRYGIIFNKWSIYVYHQDITEFDTIEEVNEEVKLIEELYNDTPKPKPKKTYWSMKKCKIPSYYVWGAKSLGEAFWGYLIVDFETEQILKWGHDCLRIWNKESDIRRIKDWLFRKENEIPEDYKWDDGEYEGWLQYRWGDGKNSIKYGEDAIVENGKDLKVCFRQCKRHSKKKNFHNAYDESEEEFLNKLNQEILEEVEAQKS